MFVVFASCVQATSVDYDQLALSIVRVAANDCSPDPNKAATGFVWKEKDYVVTSLHVISGCKQVVVHYEKAKVSRAAQPIRALKGADLALLRIDDAPSLPTLAMSDADPKVDDSLVTLGYEFGAPSMTSSRFTMRYGPRKLRNLVNEQVADLIRTAGTPDLELDIAFIGGNFVPGLSGAPIMTESGKVVAIGDGGLQGGTVGYGWAIPRTNLPKLLASTEDVATESVVATGAHFAAETYATKGQVVTCGHFELTEIREISLADVLSSVSKESQSTDDPRGLSQLSSTGIVDPSTLRFHVFQHLESGATIVIPKNATLSGHPNGCFADMPAGSIRIEVRLQRLSSDAEIQPTTFEFEASTPSPPSNAWQIDPAWSYWAPVTRFDGFVVRRKSFVKYEFGPYALQTSQNAFETLAVKHGTFLGVMTIDTDWSPTTLQRQFACRAAPMSLADCKDVNNRLKDWIESVIATHLATFPVG